MMSMLARRNMGRKGDFGEEGHMRHRGEVLAEGIREVSIFGIDSFGEC
jgi:hypothetical protein